jgi:hypothetical protein
LWRKWKYYRKAWARTKGDWVPIYLQLANSDNGDLREYALVVLTQVSDIRVDPLLFKKMEDPNPTIRELALVGLWKTGKPEFIPCPGLD